MSRKVSKGLARLAMLGLILGMGDTACAQIASAVVIRLGIGQLGTASEMINAPLTQGPMRDGRWVYEIFPDGTANTSFPPLQPAFTLPLQIPMPAPMVGLSNIWVSFSQPARLFDPGRDTAEMVDPVVVVKTIQVEAWREWVDSGVSFQAGQRFIISATGQWSAHFDQRWQGPEGNPGNPAEERAGHPPIPCAGAPSGALIARIGGGPGFLVGRGGTFTADRAGNLSFVCNDIFDGAGVQDGDCTYCVMSKGHIANNRGALTVNISPAP